MKKVFGVLVLGLFLISMASATDLASGLNRGSNQLIEATEGLLAPFASAIFGGPGDMLFEHVLFLAILLAVVYIVVSKMPIFKDNKPVIWIVTVSVSLLSTRFLMESGLVQTMILPYSVFGVTISAVLPILIYFTFVESFSESATIRKMLWIFYIVAFVGIWSSRYDSIGKLSWIYFASAVAALIFLLFDGTIRRAIIKQKMKELSIDNREDFIIKIRKQLAELEANMTAGYLTEARYKKIKKRLNKQMESIMKN